MLPQDKLVERNHCFPNMPPDSSRAVARTLIGGCIYEYTPEYMNIHPPPISVLATALDSGPIRKPCFSSMFPKGGQTRKHCFLAMFPKVRQTKKHCFLTMFPEGWQKPCRKHCFLAMFPEDRQTRKHCFLAIFPKDSQTGKNCFLAVFPEVDKPGNIVS